MSLPNIIIDNKIIWLEVPKKGNPSPWEPGKAYKIGDTVIPTAGVEIPEGKENVMFQCIGYCGKSSESIPVFPNVVGDTVIDNDIEWVCRNPEDNPHQLSKQEYYLIDRTITVS